ncbi:MAG: extracellular solute-binding protein [Deltaproteobacteria bacterium]|nr:extracellular solute-binding protein [Deltaproteobacteria bacterium]
MFRLLLIIILCFLGCKTPQAPGSRETITYTFDNQIQKLICHLAQEHQIPAYQDFDRRFKGLFVPENLLPYEPFVLALSTESKIPTVLLLDAPWVRRYAMAGWLYEMERTGVFSKDDLVPAVAEAFSVSVPEITGLSKAELMAVPISIKGNILFYRQDLLSRYHQEPPRDWAGLKAVCQKILPQEPSLKYGLIFHATNFINDFYPILWGFGGAILDGQGHLVLNRPEVLAAGIEALQEICKMSGTLAPSIRELKEFEAPQSLRQAFYRGEALFMINWNTRMQDLKEIIQQGDRPTPYSLTDLNQVGVAPIPCRAGHPHRYSNVGSFGWGINRFAITNHLIMATARQFINLVTNDRFQVLAAETLGQIPALQSALTQVKNKEVWQVYQATFALADLVLRPRPQSRIVNNILEKYLLEALHGQSSPEAALTAASVELQEVVRKE